MEKAIRGEADGNGRGDKPQTRVRGDLSNLENNPMARGNVHGAVQRGNGLSQAVKDSPNGPVKYINPNHPCLT